MQKIILHLLFSFMLVNATGQLQKKISLYLSAQYHQTLYDRMKSENPLGFGFGIQSFVHLHSKIKPMLDLSVEVYPAKSKVAFLNPDGSLIENIDALTNLFAGVSYHPARRAFIAFSAGPCFANGNILLGVRPAVGFYFSSSQKCMGRLSYTNIFHRDKYTQQDLGVLSFGIGIRFF